MGKKRKNKSAVKRNPIVKPYCPPRMERYEGGLNGHSMMWGCTECLTLCHSKITAAQHSIDCGKIMQDILQEPSVKPPTPEEQISYYPCDICDVFFTRHVRLIAHMKTHNISSDTD